MWWNIRGEHKEGREEGGETCFSEERLIRDVETEEAIDACEAVLNYNSAIDAILLSNNREEFVEGALKGEKLLQIGALIDQRLDECQSLCGGSETIDTQLGHAHHF